MSDRVQWLIDVEKSPKVDGLIKVRDYQRNGRPPEEVAIILKAEEYGAHSVFFEAGRNGNPPVAQAFVFVSDDQVDDLDFARLHRRLWSWGGVPLVYRKTRGLIQLFRCAHEADFISKTGELKAHPVKTLDVASQISAQAVDPWWDFHQLRNGTLWDDPDVCRMLLSARRAAHKRLIDAVKQLNNDLNDERVLKRHLRRRLLILSLLIAYLEARGVFLSGYFEKYLKGATKFFHVLANGDALVSLLSDLETRFNGNVFALPRVDRDALKYNGQLSRFADLIEAKREQGGQLSLWELYSFKDLPVELISHIYQLFVDDNGTSVYTPPFLVRLILDETLSWERLDQLHENDEVILDPACGSGVFLVEAYKRLILHWRYRNNWETPKEKDLKKLLQRVHGIDIEAGAIELAAFSLYLALCEALKPESIRASIKLFDPLVGKTLHTSCFFEAKEQGLITQKVGVLTGNPPFKSHLNTNGAKRSYKRYKATHGQLPDKQLAYLFLHEGMEMVSEGGVLSLLQQYNLLYNQQSLNFRRQFLSRWDVREILDFISIDGLFKRANANTKVIVVIAEAKKPNANRKILHATFRRSGRVEAQQGFDIDYYDLHWLPRREVLSNDRVWRTNLLGGGRVLGLIDRLKTFRTLRQYATHQQWNFGEGFIGGSQGKKAPHISGKPFLPSEFLSEGGIDETGITKGPSQPIERPRTKERFSPPILLVREQMDLHHDIWNDYLTYTNQIVGFAAPRTQEKELRRVGQWFASNAEALRAYVAATSVKLFTQKATTLSEADILDLPYPQEGTLDLSQNERIQIEDIVEYYRDLIRLGEDSRALNDRGHEALPDFNDVFTGQINAIYKNKPLRPLEAQTWPGIICQPFVFGEGSVDWSAAEELKEKLDALLHEKSKTNLYVTRIARIYDNNFIFLLKPDRLRYWLRSTALRDADETLAALRDQGF